MQLKNSQTYNKKQYSKTIFKKQYLEEKQYSKSLSSCSCSLLPGCGFGAYNKQYKMSEGHDKKTKQNKFQQTLQNNHHQTLFSSVNFKNTFSKTTLESARHISQVPHSTGTGSLPTNCLDAPVIWNHNKYEKSNLITDKCIGSQQ